MAAVQTYSDGLDGPLQSQLACYNLARSFLTVDLPHLAEPLLRRCLQLPSELKRRVAALDAVGTPCLPSGVLQQELVLAEGHVFPSDPVYERDQAVLKYMTQQRVPTAKGQQPAAKKGKVTAAHNGLRDPLDLTPEAAYNLALLYHRAGNVDSARRVLHRHVEW